MVQREREKERNEAQNTISLYYNDQVVDPFSPKLVAWKGKPPFDNLHTGVRWLINLKVSDLASFFE